MKWRNSFIFLAILFTFSGQAFSDDDCRGHSCNDGGSVDIDIGDTIVDVDAGDTIVDVGGTEVVNNIAGDTITGGDVSLDSEAWAFSHGLGDVDINQCLASTQFGTVLFSKQGVKLNQWCAAADLDQKGMYKQAARLRCQIKEVRLLYRTSGRWIFSKYDMTPCVDEWTFKPPALPPDPAPPAAAIMPATDPGLVMSDQVDEDDDENDHDIQIAALRSDFEAEKSRRKRAQRVAQQQAEQEALEAEELLMQYSVLVEKEQQK